MSTKALIAVSVVAAAIVGGATYEVGRGHALAMAADSLEQQNARLSVQLARANQTPAVVSPAPRSAAAPTAIAVAAPASGRAGANPGVASPEESRAFLAANPELRQALASTYHDENSERYRELMDSLSLTDAEKEQFLQILALGSMRILGSYPLKLAEPDYTNADYTRQLKELLGDARYEQFRSYSRGSAERELADDVVKSLYYTATPLRPEQAAALKKVYAQAAQEEKYGVSVWSNAPDAVWEKTIAGLRDILSAPQLAVLGEIRQESKFFRDQSTARGVWDAKQKAAAKP